MSFPRYPKYKSSGVEWLGDVPEHWNVKRFQRCVCVAEGQVDPENATYSGMSLIAPNHIESATGRLLRLETAGDQGAESGKYICKAGDVVYSKIRPALRKVCIAPEDCLCSADMYPLRSHSGLSNSFLFWLILSEEFSALAVLESQRVAMPKINRESLKAVMFSLPSQAEQTGIAGFLDRETLKIDSLVAEQRRLIELLKEKRQAVISHAVTKGLNPHAPTKPSGIEWLGDVPETWEVVPVKFLANVGNGSTPSREVPEYWNENGFPWLNSSVVNQTIITAAEGYVTERALRECHLPVIEPPAVLVGISGQGRTRGMAAMLGIVATINQHVAYVKPNDAMLDVTFMLRLFESAYDKLRRDSEEAGATKGAITCEQIRTFRFQFRRFLNKEE